MRVHHIALRVRDLERCAAFYRDVLGLTEHSRPREGAIWFSLSEAVLMLERTASEPFLADQPGIHLLALSIQGAERAGWEERLGERITHKTDHTLYVRDPEGNRIGLSHFPLTWEAP